MTVASREDPLYIEWRDKVFKRDRYTCQFCGEKGGKLEAHHINGFDTFVEQRVRVENGICLCQKHHDEFHIKYGKGGNTQKQLDEFLKNRTYKTLKNFMKRLF